MSASNAAAVRRRVGNQNNNPTQIGTSGSSTTPSTNNSNTPAKQNGMTLQEVISHFNTKIQTLEGNLSKVYPSATNNDSTAPTSNDTPNSQELNVIFSEFNDRFELFAQEIALMKEQLLKLQTYTMDVNKVLYEERIRVLSSDEGKNIISSQELESITDDVGAQSITDNTSENNVNETPSMNMMEELKTTTSGEGN